MQLTQTHPTIWLRLRFRIFAILMCLPQVASAALGQSVSDPGDAVLADLAFDLLKSSLTCPVRPQQSEMNTEHDHVNLSGDAREIKLSIEKYTISYAAGFPDESTHLTNATIKTSGLAKISAWSTSYSSGISFECKNNNRCISGDHITSLTTCDKEAAQNAVSAGRVLVNLYSGTSPGRDGSDSGLNRYNSLWTHNGSIIGLTAAGAERQLYYSQPRPGMVKNGAKPGDLLFEGRRAGAAITGTAYVFSERCGKAGYSVTGAVSKDQRTIRLNGDAPRRDDNCNIVGTRKDVLVFVYSSTGESQ